MLPHQLNRLARHCAVGLAQGLCNLGVKILENEES